MRLEETAPMTCGYWILERSDPISVDMVWYLAAEEVTVWYDFTEIFWSLGVLSRLWEPFECLTSWMHTWEVPKIADILLYSLHITSSESSWNFHEENVLCMQYRKGSRFGRSWAGGTLKSGVCRWWGYEPHRSFLQSDVFILYLT